MAAVQHFLSAIKVADQSAGFAHQDYSGGHVPGFEAALPETVAPVITVITPGTCVAASVLMLLILAYANGLRTIAIDSMPGSLTSSM